MASSRSFINFLTSGNRSEEALIFKILARLILTLICFADIIYLRFMLLANGLAEASDSSNFFY